MCHCGELVSTNGTPAPETFSVIGTADEEESLESWAHAAAEYVTAVRNGHRDSWMAQHFSHLPDASDSEVLSDLIDIAAYPDRTATAQEDLEAVLHAL